MPQLANNCVDGHITVSPGRTDTAVDCSYLSASVDVHMLQQTMQCAVGLSQVGWAVQMLSGDYLEYGFMLFSAGHIL
jgi:hypothetical protein